MTNEQFARKYTYGESYEKECYDAMIEMAQWKDDQPIYELGGWHTEKPTRDCWVLLETSEGYYQIACWENTSGVFTISNDEECDKWYRWKVIEYR